MDINRNQFFLAGLLILLIGLQFRVVESFVLSEPVTQYLVDNFGTQESGGAAGVLSSVGPPAKRTLHPPEWLGWALISIGSVLILHSLAMSPPD